MRTFARTLSSPCRRPAQNLRDARVWRDKIATIEGAALDGAAMDRSA
jgi:hypothetical protein